MENRPAGWEKCGDAPIPPLRPASRRAFLDWLVVCHERELDSIDEELKQLDYNAAYNAALGAVAVELSSRAAALQAWRSSGYVAHWFAGGTLPADAELRYGAELLLNVSRAVEALKKED
jgi:hypothetical protein